MENMSRELTIRGEQLLSSATSAHNSHQTRSRIADLRKYLLELEEKAEILEYIREKFTCKGCLKDLDKYVIGTRSCPSCTRFNTLLFSDAFGLQVLRNKKGEGNGENSSQ